MEKEKAALAVSIQKEKQELSQIASTKAEIKSVEQISTGKTMFGGKITVDEEDYKKVTSLAKKQLASESKEKQMSKELTSLRKENKTLKTENFLSEHGLLDYFKNTFIHSNNRDL